MAKKPAKKKTTKLTIREKRCCQLYNVDPRSKADSYREVYKCSKTVAATAGPRMFRFVHVKAYLAELQSKVEAKAEKKAGKKRAVKKAVVTCTVVSVGGTSKLTPLQDRFNLEYIIDFNGTAAYQRASLPRKVSKETAAVNSSKLLRLTKVQERIAELVTERQKRTQTKADDAMNECCRIAYADIGQVFNKDNTLKAIHEMPEDIRHAVSSIEVDEIYEGVGKDRELVGYTKKIKFWNKGKQIETLFKHHGLFSKDNDQKGKSLAQLISEAVDSDK